MILNTVDDTRAFGQRLAAILRPGDLVVLSGPLGAGKTALAQGVGRGLNVLGDVTSPTFVATREYVTVDPSSYGPSLVTVLVSSSSGDCSIVTSTSASSWSVWSESPRATLR